VKNTFNLPLRPLTKPGFTMIEILVAVAVLSMVVILLFGLVESATRLWRDNENRVDAFREARAALAVISSDLRSTTPGTNYFSLTNIGAAAAGANSNGLYFLARVAPTAQGGGNKSDLCAIGYFQRWAKQNDGFGQTNAADPTKQGYQLFRSFYGSDLTYSNLLNNVIPLGGLQVPEAAGAPKAEILARNILALEVDCFATNAAYTNSAQAYLPWVYSTNSPIPQMIEIRITAISDETARKLSGDVSRWTTNDALVAREARTFISRVTLPQYRTNN
jgi:prepilin-type N-terminal cleavage/methylation domain-containing protein